MVLHEWHTSVSKKITSDENMLTSGEKTISLKENAYNQLKQAIVSRSFPPGELLNERSLAQMLSVSRTPVREALQVLEAEGWVTVLPWKGVIIRPVTMEDVDEVFQLRLILEPLVIDMVVGKMDRAELYYLDDLHRRQSRIGSPDAARQFIEIDQEFHLYLAAKTRNARLLSFMTQLRDIHLRMGVEAVMDHVRFDRTLKEHRAIIDALKESNVMAARQAMLYHIVHTHESIAGRAREALQKQGEAL